jgi:hypothetical protein
MLTLDDCADNKDANRPSLFHETQISILFFNNLHGYLQEFMLNRIPFSGFLQKTETALSSSPRINAQNLHKSSHFFEMAQRQPHRFIIPPKDIHKEPVFPRLSLHWARFDLAQIEVTQSKYAERLKERSRHILKGKDERSFASIGCNPLRLLDEKKSGKVLSIIFQTRHQDLSSILFGSLSAGNSCGIWQVVGQTVLNRSCRVVKAHRRRFPMATEELAALV